MLLTSSSSLRNGHSLGSVKKCSEIFSTPLGKLVPKLLPICLYICLFVCLFICICVYFFSLFVHFFAVGLLSVFVYIPLSVCLLLVSLYSHDLVPDCAVFLLSDIELCHVNTVLHCGSCSSLRFVMGQPQL